jgi:hypothetical protein
LAREKADEIPPHTTGWLCPYGGSFSSRNFTYIIAPRGKELKQAMNEQAFGYKNRSQFA